MILLGSIAYGQEVAAKPSSFDAELMISILLTGLMALLAVVIYILGKVLVSTVRQNVNKIKKTLLIPKDKGIVAINKINGTNEECSLFSAFRSSHTLFKKLKILPIYFLPVKIVDNGFKVILNELQLIIFFYCKQ